MDSGSDSSSSDSDEDVQVGDNEAGIETMANGTPEDFSNVRGFPKAITDTWLRGTATDKVNPDGKVDDINRKVGNNPDTSRAAWKATRDESRKVAA